MFTDGTQANSGSPGLTVAGARILVVRLGAMGDIIHTLPAVASLKHSFPGSHLTWVVEPRWAPLLEENPFVNKVEVLHRGDLRGLLQNLRDLRSAHFDFAVDFQGLMKSSLVACLARPERIFGFHRSQVRERAAALAYSAVVKSRSAHVVDRNVDLAVAAGAVSVLHAFHVPPGRPEGDLPSGPFVLASPFAGWTSKQWPLDYYGQLGALLQQRLRVPLVLNGPPATAEATGSMPGVWPHDSGIPGLIDATRRATAVVGVDSGPLHLAAALGRPGVAIYGPTDPARNGPYGGTFTVLRTPGALTTYKREAALSASMQAISPELVFESLSAQLAAVCGSAGSPA
jgi:heptosyltransferase-1